jgi:hypothetical protein
MHGLDQAIGAKASQTENQNNWLTYVKLGKIGNEPVVHRNWPVARLGWTAARQDLGCFLDISSVVR